MTLDEAQSLSAGIHRAAKELNTLIYEASAAGLSVGVEVLNEFVVHGDKISTVQTEVAMPLHGKMATGGVVIKFDVTNDEAAAWARQNSDAIAAIHRMIPNAVRDAQARGKL